MTQAVAITKNTAELERLEGIIRRNLQSFYEVGRALMEIRDSGLYRDVLGFDTFEAYCKSKWDFASNYARRLMASAETFDNVKNVPIGTVPATETQCRPLVSLNAPQQREAWAKAVETAQEGKVTAAHVQKVVCTMAQKEEIPETQHLYNCTGEKHLDFSRTFVLYSNSGRRDLPGCSAWTSEQHSPGTGSASFFMRGAWGRVPSPAWDATGAKSPGTIPANIESVRKDGPETL